MKICALEQKNSAEHCATLFARSNKMYTRKNISKKHQQFEKCSRFWSQQIKKSGRGGGKAAWAVAYAIPTLLHKQNGGEIKSEVMTCKNVFTRAIQSSLHKFWLLIVLCPEEDACSTEWMQYTPPFICLLMNDLFPIAFLPIFWTTNKIIGQLT